MMTTKEVCRQAMFSSRCWVNELGNLVNETATISLNHEPMLSWLCVASRGFQRFVWDSSVATRYINCLEMGYAELGLSEARPKSGTDPRARLSLKFVSAVCLGQFTPPVSPGLTGAFQVDSLTQNWEHEQSVQWRCFSYLLAVCAQCR
jgi:hypothetical protein